MEKILIVEDDQATLLEVSSILQEAGFCCDSVSAGAAALDALQGSDYAVVLTGCGTSTPTCDRFIATVGKKLPKAGIIAITEQSEKVAAAAALQSGAFACLTRPVDPDELRHAVGSVLHQRQLVDENNELKRQVTLFQKGAELAGCLDLDPLAGIVVSVMAAEAGLQRGLGLLYDEEGYLSLKGVLNLDEGSGRAFAEIVMAAHEGSADSGDAAIVLDIVPEGHPTGIRDALIIRLNAGGRPQGVVALFSNRDDRLAPGMDLRGIIFLLQQSSRAIENATRFSTARNLANIDELTGLFNYRYLESALDREIKRAERYRSSLSVVFLDLDQFKDINDKHGHLVGSKVLKEVGLLIKGLVREVDTVIRYGGDEYTIILVESTNLGAARVAERIRGAVERHRFLHEEGYDIRITASLGYACYPDDSKTYTELLEMADQAMYRGKFSGRNVVFHIRQNAHTKQGE